MWQGEAAAVLYSGGEGIRQSLEVPATLEQAQKNIESCHAESLNQIIAINGTYMPESEKGRISGGVDCIRAVEYNPDRSVAGSFTFHNGKSTIEVANIDQAQLERTTMHETNHFASYNREIIVPGKDGYTVYYTSGVRQASWFHSTQTGENISISGKNRGLNEGITTMYTNRQMAEVSPLKAAEADRQNGYPHATEICRQLEQMVGQDAVAKAYYGGDTKALEAKVDGMAGEKAFENLSRCVERATYSGDYGERVTAMKEAQEILAKMDEKGEER